LANLDTDAFTDTGGTDLEDHTSTGNGKAWTRHFGSLAIDAGGTFCTLDTQASVRPMFELELAPSTADYSAEIGCIFRTGAANDQCNVAVRVANVVADDDMDAYIALVSDVGINKLYKSVGTTRTQLGSDGSTSAPVDDTEHKLKITADGTTISGAWKGVEIDSVTDSALTAAGNPAIGSGIRAQSRNDDCDYDNLTVDETAAAETIEADKWHPAIQQPYPHINQVIPYQKS